MELTVLENKFFGIPEELKLKRQWILSKDKIPKNEKGYAINAYDPSNWKTFYELKIPNGFMPSFVFDNDYVGVDLDNCFNDDGSLKRWAENALQTIKNPYVEKTISGRGLHLFFKCTPFFEDKPGINIKINKIKEFENEHFKDGCEIYSNKRAFVCTGQVYKTYNKINQDASCLLSLYKFLKNVDHSTKLKEIPKKSYTKLDVFSQINSNLSIMDILEYYQIPVKNNKSICPFHGEKESSLTIYPFTNSYYCFGCQTGGDLIDFVSRKETITQLEAAKLIIKQFNLDININKIKINQTDEEFDPDKIPVKWDNYFVMCEWINLFDEKQKGRLSEYFELYAETQEQSKPIIKKMTILPVEQNIKKLLEHYQVEIKFNVIKLDYDVFYKGKYKQTLEKEIYNLKNHCINHNLQLTKEHLLDNLAGIGHKNQYNPWAEYLIDAHKYYLEKPDNQIFDKLLDTITSNTPFKKKYLGKFLLQMIAVGTCEDSSEITSDYMLVLKGQQFEGKTTWLKNLLPGELQQDYFLAGRPLDLNSKDSIMETTSNILVELGEVATTFKKSDQESMKNFITCPRDKFRVPYGRAAITVKRRVSLCATTNDEEYLRDLTGTRRYLTIECLAFDKQTKIDTRMLWGFFYSLHLLGRTYKFTADEVKEINNYNEKFLKKPEKILMLEEKFELKPSPDDKDAKWYTADEIITILGNQILMNKFTVGKELRSCNVDINRNSVTKQQTYFLRRL